MCLAVPSKIISRNGMLATVDVFGARREISLMLVPDKVDVGDYVLVHAGFAIAKMDEEAALENLQLFKELAEVMAESDEKEPEQPDQAETRPGGIKN
jgi:hydrogenase expression/formation protein HypC